MILNVKQTEAIDYLEDGITEEVLFGGGAGGGKSILGTYWLTKSAYKYPESRWVMGRKTMKTLKETTYVSFLKVAAIQKLKPNRDFIVTSPQHKEYPNSILFPNKSVILLKDLDFSPSDPEYDDLGSLEITGGLIDESNQTTLKCKNILSSRMRHNITKYGIRPKLLLTCNPAKNYVYTDFYKPHRDNTLPETKKFIQSLATDNPFIDPTYISNLQKLDKNSKERLLYGNWEYDDDPAKLMDYDAICNIFSNSFIESGTGYITCDVARFGKDKTVIGIWRGWRVKLIGYKGLSTTEVAQKIEALRQEQGIPLSNIIVDEDGIGGGVVDQLRCKGFINNSRPLSNPMKMEDENYMNLKSQCYFMLADIINQNGIYVELTDTEGREELIEELEQVKRHNIDKDGKLQVLPKDKVKELIGRSPDWADTLMMRLYFELKPKIEFWTV